eukprot:6366206-Amphidinium_carterae.2
MSDTTQSSPLQSRSEHAPPCTPFSHILAEAGRLGAALAERYNLPHLSYESILENQRQAQTPLGQELRDKEKQSSRLKPKGFFGSLGSGGSAFVLSLG